MCKHGATVEQLVPISAADSHDGVARWAKKPIDKCLASVVSALNAAGIQTRSSCCGHGETDGSIVLQDGTVLAVPREYNIPGRWLHPADPARRAGFEEVTMYR